METPKIVMMIVVMHWSIVLQQMKKSRANVPLQKEHSWALQP